MDHPEAFFLIARHRLFQQWFALGLASNELISGSNVFRCPDAISQSTLNCRGNPAPPLACFA